MLIRLQILRAVAAYLVVAHHVGKMLEDVTGLVVPANDIGAAGVDLFFVISGFVMVYIAGPKASPGKFLYDRFARIAPLYWVMTAAALAVIAVAPWVFGLALVTPANIASALLFIPAFNQIGALQPILFVGWTLNWEMLFYVLFALSLFAPAAWRMITLLALMAAVFAGGFLAPGTSVFSFYGDPILFEFAAGCLIGAAVRKPDHLAILQRLPAPLLIGVGAVLFAATGLLPQAMDMRLLYWGAPATLVVLGIILLDLKQPMARGGVLARLGDASYSAYLVHMFVIQALSITVFKLLGSSPPGIAALYASAFAGTALLSLITYRLIEVPARNLLRGRAPGFGRKPAQSAAK